MGEVVIIGDATLLLGDCRALIDTLGQIDLLVTDPPYGNNLASHSTTRRVSTVSIAGNEDQAVGEAVLAWAVQRQIPRVFFAAPDAPWPGVWRNYLVWDKGGAVGGGGDPATCWKRTWELIQVAGPVKINGTRDAAVLHFPHGPEQSRHHPAEKPTGLMRYLLKKLSHPGQLIVDPCMGSGTTGVAAIELGRRFVGIDIDPHAFSVAVKRLDAAHRQGRLFAAPESAPHQQRLALKEPS